MMTHPPVIELPAITESSAWDEPILFNELETPKIPANLLPGVFGEFASALACTTETPEALSVMVILGVLSACLSKRFVVSPIPGWQEPINLYTLIALPPANHKSLVLAQCTKPLIDWENAQRLLLEGNIKRLSSERKTQEKIIEGLRLKAAKANDIAEQQLLIAEISAKEATLTAVPPLPTLFINDVTPESLAYLVHEQGGRLAIFSDEGGILETLAGLYSNGLANVDILLKGIDGGEVRIRRKDSSIALNPFLTVVLTVQPSIIQSMSEKRAYFGNGVLERFLYVLPKSKLGYRTHDKPPIPPSIQNAYHAEVTGLLNKYALDAQNNSVAALTLSDAALQLWRAFQSHIEIQLRPEGKLSNCQGWGGKICGYALRIAGLLKVAQQEREINCISENIMNNALEIAALLTEHAVAAFSLMGVDQDMEDAKAIFHWLRERTNPNFTQSEITLAMRGRKLGKAERLLKGLRVLQQRNIISQAIKLPTRKPTTLYYINPQLFS
ncbi:MAG TPA: YfjI family protein [Gammaproteobacteria bacterium]|nr:YfjI family protein [Gammaproteobacteria bacterium]